MSGHHFDRRKLLRPDLAKHVDCRQKTEVLVRHALSVTPTGLPALCRGGESFGSDFWAADIDTALEIRTVFDHDSGGLDIADQLRVFTNEHLIGGVNTPLEGANDDHLACLDGVDLHGAGRTDGQAMLRDVNTPLNLSIDGEIFLAMNLTFDDHAFPQHRGRSSGF